MGPISYLEWQKAVEIGSYAKNNKPTFTATYINKVDLNLARVHQSITYGPSQTAAVVCNHQGPPDLLNPTQPDIDNAVENAAANKNLIACVAMDYSVSPGVNNNQPFIRFLVFGPSGELLPSINLDGRREKFVPGTCVVCHGGDHYAGKYPEDGSGFANVGGHFLPYDAGNFEFASKPGLQKCDQEDAIHNLNQNVLNAGPTVAEQELIAGWYSSPGTVSCPASVAHVLNEDYVPASWNTQDSISVDFYKNVVARSCRTCHVAMIEGYNFDHYQNVSTSTSILVGAYDFGVTACGSPGGRNFQRWYTMPNSRVTFDRFWLSFQNKVGLSDQATLLAQFLQDPVSDIGNFCGPAPMLPPSRVATTASGFVYSRVSQTFNGTVTIKNISSGAINGPLQVFFNYLNSGVTLVNAAGNFFGAPYLTASTTSLAAGQSYTLNVQLKSSPNTPITFTPSTYSGSIH